jgi:hypothetical protein
MLATISFTLSFAAWGLIGGLASVFAARDGLNASQTALLVAIPASPVAATSAKGWYASGPAEAGRYGEVRPKPDITA